MVGKVAQPAETGAALRGLRRSPGVWIQCVWSPVWSLHSLWQCGEPCHLLLVCCVLLSPKVYAAIYQEILERFILLSADKLRGDADFLFQQVLAPAHRAKTTAKWRVHHVITVLDRPANSPDLNNTGNLWPTDKRQTRNTQETRMSFVNNRGLQVHPSCPIRRSPPHHATLMQ